MGYRTPSYDEVDDAVPQFEWDGDKQRWLFRRKGRGAPVLVTDEEKERFEKVQRRGTVALTILYAAVFVLGGSWAEKFLPVSSAEIRDLRVPAAVGVAFAIFGLGSSLVDWIATRPFRDRWPQGPARTRLEVWRMQSEQKSWLDFLWPAIIAVVMVFAHWPPDGPGDWTWLAIAATIAAFILFEAGLKRQTRRL
ncbi:MAG TPA: hypothetical protein VEB39_01470 [Sphingomicrobium sp.]|nr:hypothetical protein [Sphingomicrobium sp.]